MSGNSIVLVGAGSTVFTPGLMTDLASRRTFDGWTVHLVDLNGEAAETMARLGRRIAAQRGAQLTFVPHTDRREALPGARFVTTTIAVGAAEGWRHDLEIPSAYGIAQTVGDSVGPGGVLRALRHVPEVVAIAEDVADLAPAAQLVNYSNPLTANVRGITSATSVAAVGLCHGTMHTLATLAGDLDVPRDEVHAVFAGLNHLCWLLDLRRGPEDLYPRLRRLVAERAAGRDAPATSREGVHLAVSADLLRTFGRYPAPGDRHVAEFFAWYLRGQDGAPADETDLPWGLQGGRDDTLRYIGEKSDLWDRLRARADGSAPLPAGTGQEAERLVAVVEVPAVVGAAGIRAVAVGALPPGIAALLTARTQQQELTVRAALQGSRELAVQALALDPLVPSPAVAASILDDAITAHGTVLSRFRTLEEDAA